MKPNVGALDRTLRIVAGIALIVAGVATSQPLFALGIIPLATGLVSFCPLYRLVGINTCPRKPIA